MRGPVAPLIGGGDAGASRGEKFPARRGSSEGLARLCPETPDPCAGRSNRTL